MRKILKPNTSQPIKTSLDVPFDVLIGRAAMVGVVFAFGAYLAADIVSPGII